ncbi:MAG: 2OG-Fe(II) oxygenase [Gammaproteobacteria bacterium]|nr:2OG-Fe(II) oxygenase [Gammaproteobacteria bacterium]
MKIYPEFMDVSRWHWPQPVAPLDDDDLPESERPHKIRDDKVMVVRLDDMPRYRRLKGRVLDLFCEYARDYRYLIHGVVSLRYSEIGPGASLPWHADRYDQDDDRILSMTILAQNAICGGGLQFHDSNIIHLEPGDAVVFDARWTHRSVRVLQGTRKIVTAFAGGAKI